MFSEFQEGGRCRGLSARSCFRSRKGGAVRRRAAHVPAPACLAGGGAESSVAPAALGATSSLMFRNRIYVV